MDFFYIEKDLNRETELGAFGIYEPVKGLVKADLQEISEKYGKKICVLVPGLAFGKDHSRLGHGAGFYDKFLGNLKKMTGGNKVSKFPWTWCCSRLTFNYRFYHKIELSCKIGKSLVECDDFFT